MYTIKTLNAISPVGLAKLPANQFEIDNEAAAPQGILVRSADMHDAPLPDSLLAIARAGAGTNNIPVEDCTNKGIVVFNTPGANANAVAELVVGALDLPAMRMLLDACGGAPVTLHRCIDVSRDLCATYRAAAALGIDTVLTSGGAESCRKGISQLATLLRLRDELDGPEVLIGAGVNAAVIDELRAALPGTRAFHASCKTLLESGMTFRREGVPMGLPGLDEWHIQQTDADAVRAAKAAVMR